MTDWGAFVDWELVLPPNRPPEWWLDIIRSGLRDLDRGAPVAVLGSTPEFRDVLAQEGFKDVHVFDKSVAFYQYCSELRIQQTPEHFVEGDWLEALSRFESSFAAVLSDLTLGNLTYELQPTFTDLVSDALEPHGFLFDRVLLNHQGMLPLDGLIDLFQRRPFNLRTLNDFNSQFLFASELVEEAGLVDSSSTIDRLVALHDQPAIVRLASAVERITPKGCTWWYGRRWREVAAWYYPKLALRAAHASPAWEAFSGYVFAVLLERPTLDVVRTSSSEIPLLSRPVS